jgi:hypothetical protein
VRSALLVAALATTALACNASSASSSHPGVGSGDASASGDDATADGAGSGDDAGGPAPCTRPVDQRPDGSTCVLEATGTVEDLSAAPLANLVMTFCGPSQCYGGRSNDAGVYALPIGDFVITEDYAIHADGRPDHAVDYLRLAANEPQVISATMRVPALPPSSVSLPADGAPASSVTVGDVTLAVAAGTTFDLDIEDYGTPAGRVFRVAAVPLTSAPGWATAANVDAVYALAPSGAKSSNKMGVTVKNSAALPASAAVDVLVLGDDYVSSPPTVGILSVVAAAHVSADGATIQTDPGEGISEITWLAVRRKGK